jgi:hypothetical protein
VQLDFLLVFIDQEDAIGDSDNDNQWRNHSRQDRNFILNNPSVPNDHITPKINMKIEMNVARHERKNRKKISDTTSNAAPMNKPISAFMFSALMVLM